MRKFLIIIPIIIFLIFLILIFFKISILVPQRIKSLSVDNKEINGYVYKIRGDDFLIYSKVLSAIFPTHCGFRIIHINLNEKSIGDPCSFEYSKILFKKILVIDSIKSCNYLICNKGEAIYENEKFTIPKNYKPNIILSEKYIQFDYIPHNSYPNTKTVTIKVEF